VESTCVYLDYSSPKERGHTRLVVIVITLTFNHIGNQYIWKRGGFIASEVLMFIIMVLFALVVNRETFDHRFIIVCFIIIVSLMLFNIFNINFIFYLFIFLPIPIDIFFKYHILFALSPSLVQLTSIPITIPIPYSYIQHLFNDTSVVCPCCDSDNPCCLISINV